MAWLDRFSTSITPSASPLPWSRAASPAPVRRTSHLTPSAASTSTAAAASAAPPPRRPGLPQRLTSWSGLTNGSDYVSVSSTDLSTTSVRSMLAGESRKSTDSDTLTVLEDILKLDSTAEDTDHIAPGRHDFGDNDLESFLGDDTEFQEQVNAQLMTDNDQSKFTDLHDSIAVCDEVLSSVESRLANFQADLASVASEIETLQNRSSALSTTLQRRRDVEQLLGPELDALLLAPTTLRKITDGPFDDAWIKALKEVEENVQTTAGDESEDKTTMRAIVSRELRPLLDKVKDRAIERVRDFVVAQIKALRTPGQNAQVIQRQKLLKQRSSFAYLAQHQPQLEKDVAQAYVNTMKWYYQTNFTTYKQALEKMKIVAADKGSTFASEDSRKAAGVGHYDLFILGRRLDVVTAPSSAMSTQSMSEPTMVYLESIFRAYNVALIDNASCEFQFLTDFFSKSSFQTIDRMFTNIFEPSLGLGQALTKSLTEQTLDGLGVLLCVRLNQHSSFDLQRRKVPSMEGYVNGTSMLLWPRFQIIMDQHCDALRRATAATRGKPVGSALGLSTASGLQSAAPHAVTQRFANFVQGILTLSADAGDDEPVQRSVGRLRDEFDAFLVKTSKGIAEAKKRDRFLLNNYSLIGTIINETEGRLAVEVKEHYSNLQPAVS